MFCLKEGIVRPTSERIKMESQATARDFLHLLVIMASCIKSFEKGTFASRI
jgi:hypothetical protein